MSSEKPYESFLFSEHVISSNQEEKDASGDSKSSKENAQALANFSKAERSRMVKLVVRTVLHRSPFTTKYEDVRIALKQYVPVGLTPTLMKSILAESQKISRKLFGLLLCDVKLPNGRRELFMKQSISFLPHSLKIMSEGAHEVRGFILLLLPYFRAKSDSISLGELYEIFIKVGLRSKLPKDSDGDEALLAKIKCNRRRREARDSSSFSEIADYILYARDLSYIVINIKEMALDQIFIAPGFRLMQEGKLGFSWG